MRWDNVFDNLDLQWDREEDNARWDEEQENGRSIRSRMSFHDALISEYRRAGALNAVVTGVGPAVHIGRIGHSWIDGVACGPGTRVVAETTAIQCVDDHMTCQCVILPIANLEHITIGALLRQAERRRDVIVSVGTTVATIGRITAVWSDSFRLEVRGDRSLVIPFRSMVVSFPAGS
jgi:hypothetical protein